MKRINKQFAVFFYNGFSNPGCLGRHMPKVTVAVPSLICQPVHWEYNICATTQISTVGPVSEISIYRYISAVCSIRCFLKYFFSIFLLKPLKMIICCWHQTDSNNETSVFLSKRTIAVIWPQVETSIRFGPESSLHCYVGLLPRYGEQ